MFYRLEGRECSMWDYPWSGIIRQNKIFELANDYSNNGEEGNMIKRMADDTAPDMRSKLYYDKLHIFEEIEEQAEKLKVEQMDSDFTNYEESTEEERRKNEEELQKIPISF